MLRTDHCYPPTVHAPLDAPTVFDFHFEAITMPAPLPPTIEPLAPSPLPEVTFTDDEAEALWRDQQRARAAWGLGVTSRAQPAQEARNAAEREPWRIVKYTEPPRLHLWLVGVIGAAMFAVGYYVGRLLP